MPNHRGTSTVYGAPTILVSYVPWLMRYCGYYTSARRTSATAQCASYTTVATLLELHNAQLQLDDAAVETLVRPCQRPDCP